MSKKNIAVIMGGFTSEFGISMISGSVVMENLNPKLYNAYKVVISKDSWYHEDAEGEKHPINKEDFSVHTPTGHLKFDCVFNAIHGSPGEDGLIQAYLNLIGIPQTACDFYQASLTYNKRDLLSVLKAYGIPSAKSYHLNRGDLIHPEEIINAVGLPCFVKANKSGSSFGISKVYQLEDIPSAIEIAFKEDDEIIIEEALEGIEVSIGVITYDGKTKVLPATEITTDNDFFDYKAKYEGESHEITPARISSIQLKNLQETAKKIYEVLSLKGFTRSEFIFIGDIPHLLEVNTTPGMTTESLLPMQAREAGISLEELFSSAVENALK
jgi:D-alanine-D-alanine ligase